MNPSPQPTSSVLDGNAQDRMTHADLVDRARAWLISKSCSIVITEMSSGTSETPDAIGWKTAASYLIECKTSIEDFRADQRKKFRRHVHGMGELRYYMAPVGLIGIEEVPEGWGLLEVSKKVFEKRQAARFTNYSHRGERVLLLSALRRIGAQAPKGVAIKCYTIGSPNPRATLGTVAIQDEKRSLREKRKEKTGLESDIYRGGHGKDEIL